MSFRLIVCYFNLFILLENLYTELALISHLLAKENIFFPIFSSSQSRKMFALKVLAHFAALNASVSSVVINGLTFPFVFLHTFLLEPHSTLKVFPLIPASHFCT